MGCVNKSSKEFKNLAARNNLDSNTLELITHKYWLETGNETLFPTDIYIQAQLGNVQYQESGKNIRKVWEKYYSSPRVFSSLKSLENAKAYAMQFFPRSAIVYYQNSKGNFVLSIKRPVEKINKDKDAFFEEADKMGSIKDAKKINLGIKDNQTYGIGKVQELYNRFNLDKTSKALADRVFNIAEGLNLKISFNETLPFGTVGRYTNNNTITFKKSWLERDMMSEKKAPIILHEVIHAISMYALSNQTKNWKRPEALEEFRVEMNSLYQDLKSNPMLKGERGIVDLHEFVAELANPVFREKIKNIDREDNAAKRIEKKSFWSRVIDAFKKLLGLHITNTYYQRSMNALDKALDAFDIDTYMRYNGVKNTLRQGYNVKEWEFNSMSDAELKEKVDSYIEENATDNTINLNNQRIENKDNEQYEAAVKSAGRIFESTFNILGNEQQGMGRGSKEKAGNNKSLREQLHEESSRQQKDLISWATKNNQLVVEPNDYYEEKLGDSLSGSETRVWRNGNTVTKNISLNHYGTPKALMERILIHNMSFPATAMTMQKVGTSDKGMSIIVEQPLIIDSGIAPTMQEIEDYMITQGFTHTKGKGVNAEYSKDNYIVSDIRPENVIKQPDGTLAVIDCFAMFKPEAATLAPHTPKDIIKSLSGKQLRDELSVIKQESADYDLVNGVEPEHKHSGKAVPQDFTFADGTKIKAPFRPNGQQVDALNEMDRFMKSNETSMTLSGYAGTGKTSLMEMIAMKGRRQYKPVLFCATTNKAAAVLNDRVSKAGFQATTLNKTFGINVEIDLNSKTYNARNLVNVLKDVEIAPGTTVVIDEASMINEENYRILNDIAKRNRLKIIYVGDEAQLPPVNETQISKVFRNGEGKVIRLTQVERTDDNAILKEATALRNGEKLSGESSFNSKKEGVAYIASEHKNTIEEVIENYVKGLKSSPNYFRILAYTNKVVAAYNNQVRELLGYTSPIPQKGEPMMGYKQWGYDWRTKSYRLINSESYTVTATHKPFKSKIKLGDGTEIIMEATPITLVDPMGNVDTFNFMDVKNNEQNRQAAIILAKEKKRLWGQWKIAPGKHAKAEVLQSINAIDNFLFINDNIVDEGTKGKPLLAEKVIDFGYAMTIHKSQGSTFTHVLMDDVDVSKASMKDDIMSNAMEMVDLGEEDGNVPNESNLTGELEEVSLDLSGEEEATPTASKQEVNLRRQLEYVGVSRATDTVTIISNNVKKEGSPLHPENAIKEENNRSDNKNQNNESNNTRNAETPTGEQQTSNGGLLANAQARIKRGNGDLRESQKQGVLSKETIDKRNQEDRESLEKFAKEQEKWVNDVDTKLEKKYGKKIGHGSEAWVYRKDKDTVIKSRSLTGYETIQDALRSIELHNKLFPETAMKVVGFSESDGEFTVILEQSFVEGAFATNEDIATFIKEKFKDTKEDPSVEGNTSYKNNEYLLQDLKPQNVIVKVVNGEKQFYVIDGDFYDSPLSPASYEGMITPDKDTIFVFGSNPEGRHGAGAAKTAKDKFGAIYGQGEGLQGNAYALPTKDLRVKENRSLKSISAEQITDNIRKMYDVARQNPSKKFKVAYTNGLKEATLNGYTGAEMIKMFKDAGPIPSNVYFSKNWTDHWSEVKSDKENAAQEKKPTIPEQLISHLKSQGINVLNREAMAEFLKTHKLKYLQQMVNNYYMPLEDAEEVEVLRHDLFGKFKEKSSFGCIGRTANYWYLCDYFGDSNYKVRAQIFIDGNEQFLNAFENEIRGQSFRSPEDFNRRFETFRTTKGKHYNGWVDAKVRITTDGNAGVAVSKLQGSQDANQRRSNGYGSVYNAELGIESFTTPQGEVYGFVDKDGNIYLDETKISSEHPIHEYTHLWDRTVQQKNPKLWQRGVELMKQTSLWNEILNDANYGKQWQSMSLPQEKLESLIASEVHARFTGEGGEQLLEKLAKEKGQEGIIKKLKQWILDVWKDLKATFGSWSQEELDKLTLKDFNHMTVRDFTEGISLKEASNATYTKENTLDKEEVKTSVEQSSLPEATTQMIELPGYEYFNDLYDHIPVDAEWKVSYLKELDSQLSTENTEEENQNILDKMNKIIYATSKEEYLRENNNSKEKKIQKVLDEYDKLIKQINTLLGDKQVVDDGETLWDIEKEGYGRLSATEIRHIAELIANSISDMITQLKTEEGIAEKIFPAISTKLDFKTATRKQIVEAIGIDNLISKAKEKFAPETSEVDYTNVDDIIHAHLIVDNWDAMMYLAADTFAFNENFGITKDYTRGNFTTVEKAKVDFDNFNDYSNDPDVAAEEGEKDEQEHWQIESRTIDVLTSMSELVRQGLHECYLLDAEGNKVMSTWGIPERVNPRKTVNSILRWTQNSQSIEDMVAKLSAKQKSNPWLSQLITRLSDKTGNETDFQSQFYSVFSKAFQLYSIVLLEDGKYHSMNVNNHPALSEVMQTITAQFKVGEHALFSGGKVNSKLLGDEKSVGKDGAFSLHKALFEMRAIDKALKTGTALDEDMIKSATENIMGVCRIIGYPITEDVLADIVNADSIQSMTEYLGYLVKDLSAVLNAQNQGKLLNYDPFKFGGDHSIGGTLRNFLTPITDKLEDVAVAAFYDSGKMYQSYVIPSFMTNLMNKFKLEGKEFEDFVWKQYGSSEWFKKDPNDYDLSKGWRNEWLRLLVRDPNARKVFDHKVELNFNKHNYMRNMDDLEYTISLIAEYFAESTDLSDMTPSWYRIPMQSNKPSSDFIKFYSYRGRDYKKSIVSNLNKMFLQELSRIQTVRMRNLSEGDTGFIKNFDTNGRKFNFLPVFNSYLENTKVDKEKRNVILDENGNVSSENNRLATLLQKKLNGEEELTTQEEAELSKLANKVIEQSTENRVQGILDKWEALGIIEAAKSIKGIFPSELDDNDATEWTRRQVENFLWNDSFASKNILQLTITDIAFYENAENLQKRLSQLHAPGMRGRAQATDYKGNRVSDGNYRTVLLGDFDTFKSNLIANISEVFDRKIANAPTEQKPVMRALKEALVGKDGKFTHINVTDAQGFSSPSSYRKKAFIFGKWSKSAEDIYQKLKSGNDDYASLETAFQPLKPFVYSKLTKDLSVENAPIHSMQVPFQAKNSEYLLIMADAILQGEELSRPNMLRAIYRIMEDSESLMPTKGIDTIQFESAIKSGLQGALNIHQFMEMPGGEEAAYTYLKEHIFKEEYDQNTGERVYRNYDTTNFVHETSFEDYCLQQEVPEHFKEHSQAHGSQIRMIIPSDLDFYTTDEAGNQVVNYYEWAEPDGTKRRVKADEFRKEYEETIAENIKESISILTAELHLDSQDKRERNIALARILQNEIISSPRYGIDLVQACSIDKETGEFRIPKGDPIQAKRIEQLINSIIKSRINKQKIAGGPIVQVSNFGTSKQLHIRFNDKNGNLMPLESEYKASEYGGKSYKEYCHENQGGIAYFEVFAPIWSNDIFKKFSNPDGTINVAAIEATSPELLKMVSYRIPTEDKYSCAPMKVVGFMPIKAGDAIMFPYELTEIDDSDFDIDKRYVMRKDISIKEKDASEYIDELEKRGEKIYAELYKTDAAEGYVLRTINNMLKNSSKYNTDSPFRKALYSEYQKIAFKADIPTSGRAYRDNKIIDMTYAVLTNKMTADKILNPGGFDIPRKMGYMIAAYKNSAEKGVRWEDLQKMSTKELKKLSYVDKDLTFADTQVQFYKQNSAASSLIGVFAVNKVAHATLESDDLFMGIDNILGDDTSFNIGGHYEVDPTTNEKIVEGGLTFEKRMQVDPRYDKEGNLIGKILGSLVSASADAVKEPILNLMNINMTTAGMFSTMLRLGMNFEDAALFLSQDIISRLLNQFNKENLAGYESLSSIIDKWLNKYREKESIDATSDINSEALTKEELIEGLTSNKHEAIDYKVLIAFQKLRSLTDAMRKPTYVTRLNSISSAVGPLIIDNLIMEHTMEAFTMAKVDSDSSPFCTSNGTPVDGNSILANHPILEQFSKAMGIAKGLFSDMPAGSVGFRNILDNLSEGISDKIYGDKKLLDQFSNFYQSYLLVQSGMVDPQRLNYYVNKFPKEFMNKEFKKKYPDNELIQAIKFNVSKAGKPYLTIKITGMDEQAKEGLRSAWIDLHRAEPELSQDLFNYSFFIAGIGFSPKTFMALVPTLVKEKLKSKDGKTSYVDTYRNFPKVTPDLVIDQFIRNNWNNNKLVPMKGGKDTHYNINLKKGELKVYRDNEKADLYGVDYMRTKVNGDTYLWHFVKEENHDLIYERVSPLGNNGEYLEMSTSSIEKPLQDTLKTKENNDSSPLKEVSATETSGLEDTGKQPVSATETAKKNSEIVELIMKQNTKLNTVEAEDLKERIKGHEKQFARFLQNVFKHKGLDLSSDEAINEFKKLC